MCSVACENNENLPEGWKVTLKFDGNNAVRPHASRWLETSLVLSEQTFTKNIVEMKMLSSLYSDLSDIEREDEVVKYAMDPISDGNDGTGFGNDLRYTLAAVGINRNEVALERLKDVRRSAKAKEVRSPGQKCCCFGHCTFHCQSRNYEDLYGGEGILSKFQTDALCSHSSQWLERFWLSQEQYEEDVWSMSKLSKNLMELMDSVNVNLSTVDAATLGIILNYPGKCFPGDSYYRKYYSFNLSCLGLVLYL